MSKRLLGLVPMLAVVAFALIPAAAQATTGPPHYFVGGGGTGQVPPETDLLKEGKPIQILNWGGKENLNQLSEAGFIECQTVGAGEAENPKGSGSSTKAAGPAGIGKVTVAEYYNCKGTCEAAIAKEKETEGSPLFGVPGVGVASAYAEAGTAASYVVPNGANPLLEWNTKLFEASNGTSGIEEKIGEPPGTLGEILATVACTVEPEKIVAAAPKFEGELHPSVGPGFNGSGTVAGPAQAKFVKEPSSPEYSGELPGSGLKPGGGGKNEGLVRYEGYTGNELVRVDLGNE